MNGQLELTKEGFGDTQFFLQDVLQRKMFCIRVSRKKISVCCLRPWHLNGRNGRSTRQQGELRMLWSRFPELKIVGTRWVFRPKEPGFKARLVVQGQADLTLMRTDSRRDNFSWFFLVQHNAASAYLRAGGIEQLLLLMMPKQQPLPACEPGEVRLARGSTYGTRHAGRSWYQYFRDRLADKFRVHDSSLEKGLFYLYARRSAEKLCAAVSITHANPEATASDSELCL